MVSFMLPIVADDGGVALAWWHNRPTNTNTNRSKDVTTAAPETPPPTASERTDEIDLRKIRELADRLGRRPGRDKVMEEIGCGAPKATRLLKRYRETVGPHLEPVPDRSEAVDPTADRSDNPTGTPTGREAEADRPTGAVGQAVGSDLPTATPDRSGVFEDDRPTDPTGFRPVGATGQPDRPTADRSDNPTVPTGRVMVSRPDRSAASDQRSDVPDRPDRSDPTTPVGSVTAPNSTGREAVGPDRSATDPTAINPTARPSSDRSGEASPTADRSSYPTGREAESDRSTGAVGQAVGGLLGNLVKITDPDRWVQRSTGRDTDKQSAPTGRMPWFLWATAAAVGVPAFIAIWAGWVSLGLKTGWAEVKMLPSISEWTLNAVVVLPLSVEVLTLVSAGFFFHYQGTAIRWVSGVASLGSTVLGIFGQIWSHYLTASGQPAPWWLIDFVASLPVIALFVVGLLIHMAHREHLTARRNA
jgi:hypothetical protein